MTVRDFTQVFDSYAQFEESVIAAKMETVAELGKEEDGEFRGALPQFPPKKVESGRAMPQFLPREGDFGGSCSALPQFPHPVHFPWHPHPILVVPSTLWGSLRPHPLPWVHPAPHGCPLTPDTHPWCPPTPCPHPGGCPAP